MEADVKATVLRHLGKKARKYWRDVACDIIAVYQDLKPGFLYDYGAITADDLSSLTSDIIQTLLGKGSIVQEGSKLCIIKLGQDVMLANQTLLLHRLDEQRNKMRVGTSNVMDISENLASPQILSLLSPSAIKLQHDIDHLYTQHKQTITTEQVDGKIVQIEVDEDENMSTIFGLLIGYPVLYWYQGGAQASNCLDMVPLVVYEVVCDVTTSKSKCSTQAKSADIEEIQSTHHGMCASSAAITTQSSSENKDTGLLKEEHVVFSFSVPQCLAGDLDGMITLWFENLQVGGNSGLILNLHLRKKTVTLPIVAL